MNRRGSALFLVLPLLAAACTVEQDGEAATRQSEARPTRESTRTTASVTKPRFPDPYVAPVLGLSLRKPDDWVYLDETNLPDPGRFEDRVPFAELRNVIRDISMPVVAMAPRPDPIDGETPRVSVFFRFAMEPPFLQKHFRAHPESAAQNNIKRFEKLRDYQLLEPPESRELGGQPGAVTRVGYTLVDPDSGELHPVTMRIWNTKRDMGYFYVESIMPDPAPSGAERSAESIVESLHLDPPRMRPSTAQNADSPESAVLW